jgi:cytochrome b subunit of formate dehydrogenase
MSELSASPETAPERTFERLDLNQRIQHGILVVSFSTLVITGLPVRYPEALLSQWMFSLFGGPEGRALAHRIAAVVMLALGVYHVGYLLLTPKGRSELKALIPWIPDAYDAVHHLLYYVGIRKEHPKFPRFSYVEKFEYLAVVWGTVIMGATGFVLWFEVAAMRALPKWVVDVCRVAHSYEGLLAALAIVVWHFYCVHLRPGVFPMSRIWLDGRITESEMKHHHGREYEELMRREADGMPMEWPEMQPSSTVDRGEETS